MCLAHLCKKFIVFLNGRVNFKMNFCARARSSSHTHTRFAQVRIAVAVIAVALVVISNVRFVRIWFSCIRACNTVWLLAMLPPLWPPPLPARNNICPLSNKMGCLSRGVIVSYYDKRLMCRSRRCRDVQSGRHTCNFRISSRHCRLVCALSECTLPAMERHQRIYQHTIERMYRALLL